MVRSIFKIINIIDIIIRSNMLMLILSRAPNDSETGKNDELNHNTKKL